MSDNKHMLVFVKRSWQNLAEIASSLTTQSIEFLKTHLLTRLVEVESERLGRASHAPSASAGDENSECEFIRIVWAII